MAEHDLRPPGRGAGTKPRPRHRLLRRAAAGFGVLIAALFLILAGIFVFLQTGPGQVLLARELTAILSTPSGRIEIREISGSVPFDMKVGTIRLSDGGGEWLAIDDAAIEISASQLLRRRATIRQLSAASIRVARLPASTSPPPPPTAPGPPNLSVQLPKLPFEIDLQRLSAPVIELGAPLLGQPARLSLAASLTLAGGLASAKLDLSRTDSVPGQVRLELAYDGTHLDADLGVEEPTGTVLARALGRSDRLPLALRLDGHGPLVGWQGRLVATAGDPRQPAANLTASLGLDQRGDRLDATLAGGVSAASLLPPDIARIVGERLILDLAASFEGSRNRVDRLKLTGAASIVQISGEIDSATDALAGTMSADLPDLAPFSGLAGSPLAGAARLAATAGGTTRKPTLAVTADGHALAYGAYRVSELALTARAEAKGALDDPETRYALDASAHAGGINQVISTAANAPFPGELGRSLDLVVVGESDVTARNLTLRKLSVSGPGLVLAGEGQRAGVNVAGTLTLRVDDLSRFATLAKLPLAGRLVLEARLGTSGSAADLAANEAQGHLALRGSGLRTGIAEADALLAGRLDLDTDLERSSQGTLGVSKLRLTAGDLTLAGDASLAGLDPNAGVAAKLRLEVPRLAPVGAALGSPLQGSATLTAAVSGTRSTPAIKAELAGTELAAGRTQIGRLLARLEAAGIEAPAGSLDMTVDGGDLPGHAAIRFALKDRLLALSTLDIAAGGASVTGALELALGRTEASGHVAAHVPDLAPFSAIAGTPLAGRIEVQATLAKGGPRQGGQSADVRLEAAGLSKGKPDQRVTVDQIRLSAQLQDLLGKPTGSASLDIGRVVAGTAVVTASSARLSTPAAGTLAFSASSAGDFGKPFRLSLGGAASIDGRRMQLRLVSLDGQVADQLLRLTRPLLVTRSPNQLAIDGLALMLGSGSISGSGSLQGQAVAGQLRARGLPLGFLAGFGNVRNVSGTLSLDGSVSGTLAAPSGRIAVETRDLRMAPGSKPTLPAVSVSAEARLQPGSVALTGRVDTPTKDSITFTGTAPIAYVNGTYAVPREGAVSFKAAGAGRLEDLEDLLPLGEDRVAGPFSLAVSVTGTVAAPQAGGTLAIRGGRYINQKFGTELDQIDLELTGEDHRFVIRKLTATDGAAGRISGSGVVDLAAKPSPTIDVRANLARFLIAHSDLATAIAAGNATIGGTLAAPKVFARFTVDRGDIAIPSRLPPSVVELNVVVVDSRVKTSDAPPKPAPSAPAIDASLDVVIELPGRVFVRGDGVDSEWRGRVAVTGTSQAPVVNLRLETVRGTVSVLGKDFVIQHGLVTITPGSLDPQLDLLAEATTSTITADVHFTGTPTAPKLTLTSTPVVPRDEILSQVLFGKSVGQMTTGEGLQLAAAAASLAGGGPGILDRLRTATGLDRLGLGDASTATPGSAAKSSGGALGNATLSGGKYITNNVYVGIDQGASTSSTKVEVQVDILPNLSVDSTVGANSSSSLGVKWKYDY